MRREERHAQILEKLYHQDSVTVEELAGIFDVSLETIRRDLTVLAEGGLLRKVHGGAVRFQTAQEDTFALRSQVNHAAKKTIGKYAAQFVNSGDSLFINAGTTTAVFTQYLAEKTHLTIITNCVSVADTAWQTLDDSSQIFLLGGKYNGADNETQGHLLRQQLHLFHTDHAFITLGGVHARNGFMEYRIEAADIIQTMLEQARRTTVLIDSTKLDKTTMVRICALDAVDRIVTEFPPPEALATALKKAGVDVHVTGLTAE
jgi:DeoR family transcriptional regulator, glycerol-3-phosphate regulon repressor